MTTRSDVLDLVARAGLDRQQASSLWRLAGFGRMPPALLARMRGGIMLLGAGCTGLGLMFWVAANWGLLARWQQCALLQALVLAPCAIAAALGRGRAALGLLALLATGALFAYLGQTYPSGADAWQLFALWAGLSLPLAWLARSDIVWAGWAIVAFTCIGLWEETMSTPWGFSLAHGAGAAAAIALTVALRITGRHTGAGIWTGGTALVLTASGLTATALMALGGWHGSPGYYWSILLAAGVAAAALLGAKPFDVFATCVVALSLNVLLVVGLGYVLLDGRPASWIGSFLVLGIVAAGLLGGSVTLIMGQYRSAAPVHTGEQA